MHCNILHDEDTDQDLRIPQPKINDKQDRMASKIGQDPQRPTNEHVGSVYHNIQNNTIANFN